MGVQSHSTETAYRQYFIFCVGNDIAKESAFRQWATEQGIGFKSLMGCYKGVTERSFITNKNNFKAVWPWLRDQESVLLLGKMYNFGGGVHLRKAGLVFFRTLFKVQPLGYFTEVSKERAMQEDAWTFDPTEGKYWICEQR